MRDPCLGPCLPAAFPFPPGCLSDLILIRACFRDFMKVQSRGLSLGLNQSTLTANLFSMEAYVVPWEGDGEVN